MPPNRVPRNLEPKVRELCGLGGGAPKGRGRPAALAGPAVEGVKGVENAENNRRNQGITASGHTSNMCGESGCCEHPDPLTTKHPYYEGHVMAAEQNTAPTGEPQAYSIDPAARLAEIPASQVVVRACLDGEPLGKHRPRFNRRTGRVYTPDATKKHQEKLSVLAMTSLNGSKSDGEWAFGIRSIFYVQTHHRKDVDNMLKAVLDGMNRIVFEDDSQVKEIMGWSVMDCERPRTEFIVYRLHKIDRDQGHCIQCGKSFRRYKSWRGRLFCSRKCNAIHQTKSVVVLCAYCGKELLRMPCEITVNKNGEFFCSGACIGKHKRRAVNCAHCGTPISRPLSWAKPGQDNYYCSRLCYSQSRVGILRTDSAERRSEISARGWVTRRLKMA